MNCLRTYVLDCANFTLTIDFVNDFYSDNLWHNASTSELHSIGLHSDVQNGLTVITLSVSNYIFQAIVGLTFTTISLNRIFI